MVAEDGDSARSMAGSTLSAANSAVITNLGPLGRGDDDNTADAL